MAPLIASSRATARKLVASRSARPPSRWLGLSCAIALALAPLACGSKGADSARAPEGSALPESPVSRYFPLVDGTMWAYDAESDDDPSNKGMFVTRAKRVIGPRFSLISAQGAHAVEVRADGIVQVENSVYLLKAPLAVGAEWPGEGTAKVRVTSIDRQVDVPAGKFVGCVETIEETPSSTDRQTPEKRVTTTYCPDVGIALLHAEVWDGAHRQGERAKLRSFGKPVSVGP
jgi:hypothetical protein